MSQEAPQHQLAPETSFTPEEFQQRESLKGILGGKRLFLELERRNGNNGVSVLPEDIQYQLVRMGNGMPNIWLAVLSNYPCSISDFSTRERLIVKTPSARYDKAVAITNIGDKAVYAAEDWRWPYQGLNVEGWEQENPALVNLRSGFNGMIVQDSHELSGATIAKEAPIDYKAVCLGFAAKTRFNRINVLTVCKPSTPPQAQG